MDEIRLLRLIQSLAPALEKALSQTLAMTGTGMSR